MEITVKNEVPITIFFTGNLIPNSYFRGILSLGTIILTGISRGT
jgi:hypothetical protein